MKNTNVSKQLLTEQFDALTPELKKAARFVMDHPNEVGVSSMRQIAKAAKVKPNSFVRLANFLGFDGYEAFREPYREALVNGNSGFPDRARWLQDRLKSGDMGRIYGEMIAASMKNIEQTFSQIDEQALLLAAESIWKARNVFTLGVGVNHSLAQNFTYLASTGMVQFHTIPQAGSIAVDEIAWADANDVLIALTTRPYRKEVIETVTLARQQSMTIIALSDSHASPIIRMADHGFVIAVDTPQFFPSSVAIIALLEVLLSFVISKSTPDIVKRVEKFHHHRQELGLYLEET